jgi:hypothetical protein
MLHLPCQQSTTGQCKRSDSKMQRVCAPLPQADANPIEAPVPEMKVWRRDEYSLPDFTLLSKRWREAHLISL